MRRRDYEISSLDPDEYSEPDEPNKEFDLAQFVANNEADLKGRDVIKLSRAPLDLATTWVVIHQSTNLPIGLSMSACIVYVLDKLRNTPEFKDYKKIASKARAVTGLKARRKMHRLVGSMKHVTFAVEIPAIDGCAEIENISFKSSEGVRSSLYSCANELGMTASNLAIICVAKGLSDSDPELEPEFRQWANSLYDGFIAKIRERYLEIRHDYSLYCL